MDKKKITVLVCFLLGMLTQAQNIEQKEPHWIGDYFLLLDKGLMEKDTLTLSTLLHRDLTLGHSNGWIENKPDLLKTLANNGVEYHSIEITGTPIIKYYSDSLLTTRRDIDVAGIVNETSFKVQLNVLEIWICEEGNWQLLARQSVNRK